MFSVIKLRIEKRFFYIIELEVLIHGIRNRIRIKRVKEIEWLLKIVQNQSDTKKKEEEKKTSR